MARGYTVARTSVLFHAAPATNNPRAKESITSAMSLKEKLMRHPRVLLILALGSLLIGAVRPTAGSLIVLPGAGLATLVGFFAKSRYRRFVSKAFVLILLGVIAMFMLSAAGGFGGNTGRSRWWALVLLPYPVGWFMALAGTFLTVLEVFNRPRPSKKQE